MRRNRTGPATTPASGEGPGSSVVMACVGHEREQAAERAATGGGGGVGLLVGGQAASTVGDACYAVALPCYQGRSFVQRRDAAIIAVFQATGIRAAELAGIRYDVHDPRASDVDLWQREITVRGKGGKVRVVKITHDAARALDRYIRVRARHAQAWRRALWLGVNNRGPLTSNGIYQMVARRGRECGVAVHPHRFRHHFSHTWLDRGGAEADLMELNGWSSPRMLVPAGDLKPGVRARASGDLVP